jgi:UDP-N-acetyl-D-glucosamine dehydrogenase
MTNTSEHIKTLKIGIIGLGYVGLPLSLLFLEKGFQVVGIDLDQYKIKELNEVHCYLSDIIDCDLKGALSQERFIATSDYNVVKELDVIIICVPTPLAADLTPDLSYLQNVGNALNSNISKGQLVILESSTYPGTTREVLQPLLEQSGLKVGEDIFLGYSPERIDPGNKAFRIEEIPKVVSGVTEKCKSHIKDLYSQVFEKVVSVSSTEVAELTKLLENTYRFINISFINEFAILCDTLNIDVWETIQAAKTKPYGFSAFYPGPGIGGHCIPVDPLYLSWKAKQSDFKSRFIALSACMNQYISNYIVKQVTNQVLTMKRLEESNILIYGVTYKKDIHDVRESPALRIIQTLQQKGIKTSYHDPYVPELTVGDTKMNSITLSDQVLENADCVVILTDHSNIPVKQLLNKTKFVYDTRNVTRGLSGNAKVIRLGGGER